MTLLLQALVEAIKDHKDANPEMDVYKYRRNNTIIIIIIRSYIHHSRKPLLYRGWCTIDQIGTDIQIKNIHTYNKHTYNKHMIPINHPNLLEEIMKIVK